MASLLPEKLVGPAGAEVESKSLSGKILGLYFSAHWCPPCRGFTPKLVEWFANFKKNHSRKNDMELVFVSSDKDEAQWKEYFHEMTNFHALIFSDRAAKNKLSSQFKVQGIPTLVFVDEHGKTISTNGRAIVMEDAAAAEFPWTPKSLLEIVGNSFTSANGPVTADLKDKVVGFYFSAHWCPPCRAFTPDLAETYKKVKAAGKPFEIVFVTSDREESAYTEYLHTMPWIAIPYGDDARRKQLARFFEISSLPTLVIVGEDSKIITTEGRSAVASDPEGASFPWYPKALNVLTDDTINSINDSVSLVVFTDGSDEQVQTAKSALEPLAKEVEDAAKASGSPFEIQFLYTSEESDEVADSLRGFGQLGSSTPLLAIFDIPSQAKFVQTLNGKLSAEDITSFYNSFKSKALKAQGIRG